MLGRTHEIDQDALSETLGKCGVGEGQQRAFLKSCQALLSEAGPSDSSQFLSTCSSLPLVFGRSNVAC